VEVLRDSLPVLAGWNLIPTLSVPVEDSTVVSDPPSIILSPFFTFTTEGGYERATVLLPGRAYWVRVSQSGVLVLDAAAAFRGRTPPRPPFISGEVMR
jgi:hypothetical protein